MRDDKSDNKRNNSVSNYVIPKYKGIITDLRNVDIELWPGQTYYECDFYLMSAEKLDIDKVKIEFDSDIKFETEISEIDDENNFFDYNLFWLITI